MIRLLFLLAFLLTTVSCYDSSEYYFNESDCAEISLNASISHSFNKNTEIVKADTFNIEDSIVLQVSILPTRSIKMKSYRWLLDGKPYKSDFSFKDRIPTPGHHTLTFELQDYYGDFHYDSLEVWAASLPKLDKLHYLPAKGTQEVSTRGGISFAWSAHTDSIELDHYYIFTLSEQPYSNTGISFKAIDTILYEPTFTLYEPLPELREFNWTVQACNEYDLCSDDKIVSNFFTSGTLKDGSIQGSFITSSNQDIPIHVSLHQLTYNDEDNNKPYSTENEFNVFESLSSFTFGGLPAGMYNFSYNSPYKDFGSGSLNVQIRPGNITQLAPIDLNDTIPPKISSLNSSDTIEFSDTLKFVITDGGIPLLSQKINTYIEDRIVTVKSYKNDTLSIFLSEADRFWAYQPVSIKATDESGNSTSRTFYLTPSELWFTSNNDTTLYIGDSLLIHFANTNPYGFDVDSFWIDNYVEGYSLVYVNDDLESQAGAQYFTPPCTEASTQEFISTIVFTNGLRQSKKWKITFLEKDE